MIAATREEEIVRNLQKEILFNPEMRHRIILRAIKTAKTREAQKIIRKFFKREFR